MIACLAEREPVVITARLAAEIAAERTAYLVALRQASHAISEGMFPRRRLRRSPCTATCAAVPGGTDLTGSGRPTSAVGRCAGPQRSRRVVWSGSYDRLRWRPVVTERREGSDEQLAGKACRRRPKPERDQRRGGGGLDR